MKSQSFPLVDPGGATDPPPRPSQNLFILMQFFSGKIDQIGDWRPLQPPPREIHRNFPFSKRNGTPLPSLVHSVVSANATLNFVRQVQKSHILISLRAEGFGAGRCLAGRGRDVGREVVFPEICSRVQKLRIHILR